MLLSMLVSMHCRDVAQMIDGMIDCILKLH
eukprot:SAG11_NODE_33882_length_275_cov_0.500000_1_plen_29_part_10